MSRTLVAAGAAALVWCAFVIGEAYVVQRTARASLQALIHTDAAAPASTPATADGDRVTAEIVESPAAERHVVVEGRTKARSTNVGGAGRRMTVTAPLALLTIPGLNVSTVVFHGTDTHTLRVGVGHVEHTAWPGEAGNVAIAGHRDSFFRPLRNIKRGDDILLETPRGTLRYRVTLFAVVQSNDMSVLAPTREDTLTLVTCFPFSFIGTAPDRFIVKAVRVSP